MEVLYGCDLVSTVSVYLVDRTVGLRELSSGHSLVGMVGEY